jgi:abortive infection bacteriophage resistance protein
VKPFKTIPELVALLEGRGLAIDRPDGAAFLHDFNYYRFSGYARQFQMNPSGGQNKYQTGSTLTEICSVIEFDGELRKLLSAALTVVELSVRARFAHEAGKVFGQRAFYLDRANYLGSTRDLDNFLDSIHRDLTRSKSPTVARYTKVVTTTVAGNPSTQKSFDDVPIWVAVEVLSFGAIAKMLMYLTNDLPAKMVAASYSVAWDGFQNTIHSFSVMRNQCSHHGQIWHRRPSIQTPVTRKLRPRNVQYDHQGSYSAVIMLKRYMSKIKPDGTWGEEIDALLDSNSVLRMGVLQPFAK